MEFWKQHVAAAKLQGVLASAYAKQHGISVTALYYWQRKLKAPSPPLGKFVALRVVPAVVEAPPACSCTLVLASGMRLELTQLPAPQRLAALGRAAQEAR
ncbi:hypothetical protein [Polaromonas sp. CG_9.11]|uniref:IS66 family insertion sequence element accessory protein TnpA n=1 Tax=Polaromonas sp. CG_9.11 TaxID=2787730 RepID=UPI001A305C50|nr:hypothetical protein [Polaromonas sp. CG_9.11]MBG6078225.1 transposase-like protein [Polaromonas sp. CG_9.11]